MKKRKIASAIGYTPGDPAPGLLASGRDSHAERIVAVAQQAGVAVVEDESLAVLLDSFAATPHFRPGDFIPMWCWEASAKILAFIIEEERKGKKTGGKKAI